MRSAVLRTSLACLDSTGKLFYPSNLDDDELPSLVQCFLDSLGNVDDLGDWYALIPTMDESIENL